jgi:tRNA(fMet)-specific endonuclease VapC
MIVLDTDIVTLLSYGRAEKLQQRIASAEENEELAVTLVTRMEILRGRFDGILKAADEDELRKAMERFGASRDLLGSFRLLEVDDDACSHFAKMLKVKKRPKRRGDLLVACIALAHGALLVTRNTRDFEHVPGLSVENWVD